MTWTHNWNDPPNEKEASFALIDNGCDVIAQHQTAPANLQAAEARGVWGIGYHADMNDAAPEACLTSPYWNWEPFYLAVTQEVMAGTWEANNYWGGMEDDVVRLAELGKNAPAEAAAIVAEVSESLRDGSFEVFSGPLNDNDGNVILADGESMDDFAKLGMGFLVEGVIGSIEN